MSPNEHELLMREALEWHLQRARQVQVPSVIAKYTAQLLCRHDLYETRPFIECRICGARARMPT